MMPAKKDISESDRAAASVFITALRTLSASARRRVVMMIIEDENLREDVEAALLWEERKDEPRRPFREYLEEYESREN
jgi:hypothetical protein